MDPAIDEKQQVACPHCGASMADGANFCGSCGSDLSSLRPAERPLEGRLIGERYHVRGQIGSGGMGEVYEAEHVKLGQKVALKFLPRRMAGDPRLVQRFFNEARTTCRVNHPNAVNVTDFGQTEDDILYIVMEFIEGNDLTSLVRDQGRLPLPIIIHIILQLADVLHAAHEQGVVHRDLKPDNIMLREVRGGRYAVKVLDFGIARLIGDAEASMTERGMVYGTPEFMSPEQAMGQDVDGRADQYSLAILLYYLLCGGHIPFFSDDRRQVLSMQVHGVPDPPSKKTPDYDIPDEIEAIVMRGLQKNADLRFPTIAAFADAIEEAIATLRDRGFFKDEGMSRMVDMISIGLEAPETPTPNTDALSTVPVSEFESHAHFAAHDDEWTTGSGPIDAPRIGPSVVFDTIRDAPAMRSSKLDLSQPIRVEEEGPPHHRSKGPDPAKIGLIVLLVLIVVGSSVTYWGWTQGYWLVPDPVLPAFDAGGDPGSGAEDAVTETTEPDAEETDADETENPADVAAEDTAAEAPDVEPDVAPAAKTVDKPPKKRPKGNKRGRRMPVKSMDMPDEITEDTKPVKVPAETPPPTSDKPPDEGPNTEPPKTLP